MVSQRAKKGGSQRDSKRGRRNSGKTPSGREKKGSRRSRREQKRLSQREKKAAANAPIDTRGLPAAHGGSQPNAGVANAAKVTVAGPQCIAVPVQVVFDPRRKGVAQVEIVEIRAPDTLLPNARLTYKVKATRPEIMKVRPAFGYIERGRPAKLTMECTPKEGVRLPANDRLTVVTAAILPGMPQRASAIWKRGNPHEPEIVQRTPITVHYGEPKQRLPELVPVTKTPSFKEKKGSVVSMPPEPVPPPEPQPKTEPSDTGVSDKTDGAAETPDPEAHLPMPEPDPPSCDISSLMDSDEADEKTCDVTK